MSKSLVLGNGNILVGFDRFGQIKDFYYPYVGMENHVSSPCLHKIGVWIDGKLFWIDDGSWDVHVDCKQETFSSIIHARHIYSEIELELNDIVYNEKNILVRKIIVRNKRDQKQRVKLFLHSAFKLYDSERGDTAFFDPDEHVLIHYEGHRVFLINARTEKSDSFEDWSVGIFGLELKEGTYKDAEDGELSKNPIEHGKVDSVAGITLELPPNASYTVFYWIAVGQTHDEVHALNQYVIQKTPQYILESTENFWHAWANKQKFTFFGLSEDVARLFRKSLFYVRAHADNRGAIIASGDSDMLQYGRDTYGYMWPRDGAISALALAKAGDEHVAERFFGFCNAVIEKEGFFMHKYRADRSWGSSWHPWLRDGKAILPIQEDETAIVLFTLWKHYELSKDLEFIEALYNSLVKKSAEFLARYIDKDTGLPKPSYDLWEERYGIFTYTAASVYGALAAAAQFAALLGKKDAAEKFNKTAESVRNAILKYLYDNTQKIFRKMVFEENGATREDNTLDMSSVFGIIRFGVLPANDPRVEEAFRITEESLCCKTDVGGISRYEGDMYYKISGSSSGNPWFITTLWLAQYRIARAEKESDLEKVKETLRWVVKYAAPSGVLSEQLHPRTGEQISAAPLTWSHSEFIITVILYLEKLEELGICKACYPIK